MARTPDPDDVRSLVRLPKSLRALVASRSRRGRYATYVLSRIPGGVPAAIELCRLFADQDAAADAIVMAWDEKKAVDTTNRRPSIEETLDAADVSVEDAIALISRFLTRLGTAQAQLTAGAAYPYIMEASVQRAMDPEKGTDERRMHLEHHGFVQPKGGIKIAVQQNNRNGGEDDGEAAPGEAKKFDRTARTVVRNLPAAD